MTQQISLEQIVRDILEAALTEGIVKPSDIYSVDPQRLTAGDIAGVANVLRDRLSQRKSIVTASRHQ